MMRRRHWCALFLLVAVPHVLVAVADVAPPEASQLRPIEATGTTNTEDLETLGVESIIRLNTAIASNDVDLFWQAATDLRKVLEARRPSASSSSTNAPRRQLQFLKK